METGGAPPLTNGLVVFDRYRLKALVGRGAIGVVWRAFDEELEIDIALKFLAEAFLFNPAALADLKRETRRGMALSHPHILRIYGFFQGGGHAAIAMEIVEGNTLAELQAARHPHGFDASELAEWTLQLCSALQYAHIEAQVVHRDLKPGNLMIDARGRLRVADFGIAAGLNDARSRMQNATDTSGTLAYMSPQQLLGQKPGVEHDIYSLGATLYDLLTGRPPFHRGDIGSQVRTVVPPPLAQRRAENGITGGPIPAEWEETIAACLAKDASLRPASAAEVAERLRLGPLSAASPGSASRSPHSQSRSSFPTAGAAAAWQSSGQTPPTAVATDHRRHAPPTQPQAPHATPVAARRRWAWPVAAAAAVAAIAVAIGLNMRRTPAPPPGPTPAAPLAAPSQNAATTEPVARMDRNSIAVLAFKNLSGDKDREFFSDGLSEALADTLGRVPGLRVAGSASAFAFKGRQVPNPEIARQLGVAYLVEGTVRQQDIRVRITAKLVSADGFQVWVSDNLDREVKNIFAVHDELARLIAQQLSLKLGVTAPASAPVNPEAFELYLQGRQAMSVLTRPAYDRADKLLHRALELDPGFARTHAALADFILINHERALGTFSQTASPRMQEVDARIDQALALDPNLAEAHASRGLAFFLKWQFADSVRELRRAVALNPNYANAHQWLAQTLRTDGYVDDALEESKLAARLNPLSPAILDDWTAALIVAGRYTEALAVAERSLQVRPNSSDALFNQSRILARLNRTEEALANIPKIDPVLGHERRLALIAAGRADEAAALLPARTGPRRFIDLCALGRLEESIAALSETRFSAVDLNPLYFEPFCAPLRRDPRVAEFIAKLGQKQAFERVQAWWAAQPPTTR